MDSGILMRLKYVLQKVVQILGIRSCFGHAGQNDDNLEGRDENHSASSNMSNTPSGSEFEEDRLLSPVDEGGEASSGCDVRVEETLPPSSMAALEPSRLPNFHESTDIINNGEQSKGKPRDKATEQEAVYSSRGCSGCSRCQEVSVLNVEDSAESISS